MKNRYAVVELSGVFRETEPLVKTLVPQRMGRDFRFDRFLVVIEALLADRRVRKVLVDCKPDFRPNYRAGAEAVRQQLVRLALAGKEVHFYAPEYEGRELYLAGACSESLVHPLGRVRFLGVSQDFLFFKRFLDKRKVKVRVVRRGKYKSALDTVRVDKIDAAQREQYEALLDGTMKALREGIRGASGKSDADLDELLQGRVLAAEEAAAAGWVGAVKTPQVLLAQWDKEGLKKARFRRLGGSFGRGKRLAVLVFEGGIVEGRSRRDPLMGQAVGTDSYVPVIEKLAKDRRIRGVVFRINSGGGSAIASEDIAAALARLREKKPLVVSMSEVAASGGYWIALHGERIFAESTTLTGSIGVIGAYSEAQKLLESWGITHDNLKRGEMADLGSVFRRPSRREIAVVEELVEQVYQAFLQKVAAGRGKSVEQVHELAQGRVWSGADASEAGIVDQVGGLSEALAYLKGKLKLKKARVQFYPAVRYSLLERFIYRRRSLGAAAGEEWPEALRLLSGAAALLCLPAGEPLALMLEQLWLRRAPW